MKNNCHIIGIFILGMCLLFSSGCKKAKAPIIKSTEKANSIQGAFGFTLGQQLRLNSNTNIAEPIEVKPERPFRKFNFYSVSVTKEHLVYLIVAEAEFTSKDAAEEEQDVVNAMLEEKYGEMKHHTNFTKRIYEVQINARTVRTEVSKIENVYVLYLCYYDDALANKDKNDKLEKEKATSDTSAI